MYSIDWSKIFRRSSRVDTGFIVAPVPEGAGETKPGSAKTWLPVVSRTVWALGVTSLLTDISSEMVASILPVYLVLHLGMSPLAFGVADGIYQGAAALVRLASGIIADRWGRHKEVAALGYGLSAVCRLLILVVGSAWGMIAVIITMDRIGKGIRTAPRDALISRSSRPSMLATAFGVHRAMDAVGAMLGPIVAFSMLALLPGKFDLLFVASFAIAILGFAAIVLFVPGATPDESGSAPLDEQVENVDPVPRPDSATKSSTGVQSISLKSALWLIGEARFRGLMIAGVLLGVTTISDSFIYLVLQRKLEIGVTAFPLFYVGTALFTSLLAIPCGRLADRFGRTRVLLVGYGSLVLVYISLLLPSNWGMGLIAVAVLLLGVFYAATDGVLTAMAAGSLPVSHLGSGLALFATATNLARLLASVIYGFLWWRVGIGQATLLYLLALVLAFGVTALVLNRSKQSHAS